MYCTSMEKEKDVYQKAQVVIQDGESLNSSKIQFSDDGRYGDAMMALGIDSIAP